MKSTMIRGALVGLAVMLSTQAAQAQGISLGLGGGVVVPTGDLANGFSTGWSGTAQLRVKPPVSPLGLQVDAFYSRFAFDGLDGHGRIVGATANALFAFPGVSAARPYLVGGLGLYNTKVLSESQSKFGLNAGAGFDFGLGKVNLFAEGRFHMIMKQLPDANGGEKSGYMIPLTVGVRF